MPLRSRFIVSTGKKNTCGVVPNRLNMSKFYIFRIQFIHPLEKKKIKIFRDLFTFFENLDFTWIYKKKKYQFNFSFKM